jgi:hypothetical protein
LEERVAALEAKGDSVYAPGLGSVDEDTITRIVAKVMEMVLPKVLATAQEAAGEAMEREGKKSKLVLVGLDEAADNSVFINEACNKLSIDRSDIVDFYRDGKPKDNGYARIMKIKFKHSNARRKFLTGFRDVRVALSLGNTAWVRPDLTWQQRQLDFKLRTELKRRRDNGEQVKISRGEIVVLNG